MPPTIRRYTHADRAACLNLFRSNQPEYFSESEFEDFAAYLERAGTYWVVEEGEAVVACGGIWQEGGESGFAWGMVERDRHRQGIGRLLAEVRLDALRAAGAKAVKLDTSPESAPFYARLGFRETQRTPDGYGAGRDRIDMVLDLPGR